MDEPIGNRWRSCAVTAVLSAVGASRRLSRTLQRRLLPGRRRPGSDEPAGADSPEASGAGDGRGARDEQRLVTAGVVGTRKRGTEIAATLNDQWHLGSDTKAMTATLVAKLVEKGRLKWESTVAEVFPDLAAGFRRRGSHDHCPSTPVPSLRPEAQPGPGRLRRGRRRQGAAASGEG